MRIVHVVPYKLDPFSGVYTAIVGLVTALARAGNQVEVWNLSPWPANRTELVAALDDAGIVHREIPESPNTWSLAPAARQMLDDELEGDVVHLHSAFSPQNNLLARRIARPIVLSPHGVYSAASLAQSAVKKRVFRRLVELPMLRRVAAAFALTPAEAGEIEAFGFEGPTHVIPNGVADPPFGLDSSALRAQLGLEPSERLALFVGRIDLYHKRIDEAVRQVAASPGWHLAVVGPDYRADRLRLEEIKHGLAGGDRIHLVGPRRGRELHEAYAGADLFVLLSRFEGMPMVLLEALSHGLPAAVSPEVEATLPVTASGAGWVAPEGALSSQLEALSTMPSGDWESARAAALRLAGAYRWDAIASAYLDAYQAASATAGQVR